MKKIRSYIVIGLMAVAAMAVSASRADAYVFTVWLTQIYFDGAPLGGPMYDTVYLGGDGCSSGWGSWYNWPGFRCESTYLYQCDSDSGVCN